MRGLGAPLAVTVTAANSCPMSYTDVSDPSNPKVVAVSAIEHDLCLARYYVVQMWDTIEGWAKSTLQFLEQELSSLWKVITGTGGTIWQWIKDLGGRVKQFIQWLDDQAAKAEFWLGIVGLGMLAFVLAPAINDLASNVRRERVAKK